MPPIRRLVAGVRVAARLDVADAGTAGRGFRGRADERGECQRADEDCEEGPRPHACVVGGCSACSDPSNLRSRPNQAAPPTMRRDGDDRGPRRGGVARRVERELYDGAPERTGELFSTISGLENEPLYDPGARRARLRPRPRLPGRISVHPRRLSVDVPRPALDDAPVRRLRHGRGDERALPLPARARADGPLDGLRHADADGLRLRPRALARRGRSRRGRGRLARRHGDALRRDPAGRGLDLDDDQLAGGDRARVLHLRRRAAGRLARQAPRDDPDGHPQGVHRAEGVDLPARAVDAAGRRHDRVLRARDAALAPDLDLRVPHPRGRLERRAGARVHARRRLRLRRGGGRARPRRRRVRAAALLLLQRPPRLLRGDRQVPRRPPHLGAGAARQLRREEPALAARCASTRRPPASR